MSNDDLAKRVKELEKSLFGVKLGLAWANNATFEIKEKMQGNHRIAHVDWIYHFFEHDEKMSLQGKRQLASTIVFVLFNEVGDDLLVVNPEEFNMINTRSRLCVTRKDEVVIKGHRTNDRLLGLKREVEQRAEGMGAGVPDFDESNSGPRAANLAMIRDT